jgi:hypothetical protein
MRLKLILVALMTLAAAGVAGTPGWADGPDPAVQVRQVPAAGPVPHRPAGKPAPAKAKTYRRTARPESGTHRRLTAQVPDFGTADPVLRQYAAGTLSTDDLVRDGLLSVAAPGKLPASLRPKEPLGAAPGSTSAGCSGMPARPAQRPGSTSPAR